MFPVERRPLSNEAVEQIPAEKTLTMYATPAADESEHTCVLSLLSLGRLHFIPPPRVACVSTLSLLSSSAKSRVTPKKRMRATKMSKPEKRPSIEEFASDIIKANIGFLP